MPYKHGSSYERMGADWWREYRKRKVAAGLCSQCIQPVKEGFKLCGSHLKGRVCQQCGEPTDGRAQLCPAHKAASLAANAKQRRLRKKGRAQDKANGICTRNGCHEIGGDRQDVL